jgi:hypothetical protein
VSDYQRQHPDWIFIRHEDISLDPVGKFRSLFEALGLTFTPAVETHIREYSAGANPKETPEGKATFLKRDSKENIYNWKKRVTPAEMEQTRKEVAEVAAHFYPDSEW